MISRNTKDKKSLKGREKKLGNCLKSQPETSRLQSVFAASPDAITVTDLKGNIVDCNQATLELYGSSSKKEMVGKSALQFIAVRDRAKALANLKKTLKKGAIRNVEYTLLTKHGTEYPAELSASVVKDSSGNPSHFVAIIKEISGRKRVEDALRGSEERYRSVIDNIGVGVSIINPTMRILALNNQMRKWFPKIDPSRRPACYKAFNEPPRKKICTYCPTIKTLTDGLVHESITNTPRKNKIINYRVISSPLKDREGKIIAAIEMVDDITERIKMERKLERYAQTLEKLVEERTCKLRESESMFSSVVNYASEAIITLDARGKVVFWNKAAERVFGHSADEAIGKSVTLIMPKWAHRKECKAIGKGMLAVDSDAIGKKVELIGLKKDGKEFPIELSLSAATIQGKLDSLCIIRDISEQKIQEERLAALNTYGGMLNAAKSIKEVYELTLDAMQRTLGFEHGSFLIAENRMLKPVCQRGYPAKLDFELPLDGSGKGITVRTATRREPSLVPDTAEDRDYVRGDPKGPVGRSELAVPMLVDDQVFGVLNVESIERNAFDEKDLILLSSLSSQAATAISNLIKRDEIEKRSIQQASLMKSSTEMIHSSDLRQRLRAIMGAIHGLGWRRVVLSVRDESLNIAKPEDIVTAGLTKKEEKFLWTNRQAGHVWIERFGPEFERFKIGEFYYLPWSDPFVRRRFSQGTVSSHLKAEEMVDWDPDDLLYAPLRLADGRTVAVVSMDDPVDGKRPTEESMAPLELFLHQAAVAIENAKLIKQLNDAKAQVQEYAGQLEIKVMDRTRALVKAQNKLLKTERLAAIGELAGMVGHDLRNPLTGIAGATYYIKTKYRSKIDQKGAEMLELIERDIESSNKIINDLLEYSKDINLELKETSPKAIVKEALSSIKAPDSVQVIDKTRHKPRMRIDTERMKRVVTNIIKNAFDAMPNGGTLTVENRNVENGVVIDFSDTGTGMTKETMQKLWTPLFTTKAKGMGFGLPICKRIIEGHGGNITVESALGKGCTFSILLPLEPKIEKRNEQIWINLPEQLSVTTTKESKQL